MPRPITLIARGATHRGALRALARVLDAALSEQEDPETVVTIQARAEREGPGYVAEASLWRVRKYRDPDG